MRNPLVPAMGLVMSLCVFSQSADTRPKFEVASIRQCVGTEPRASLNASHGRLSVPCGGLFRLIQDAYQIYADGTTRFVIQPTAPDTDRRLSERNVLLPVFHQRESGVSAELGTDDGADVAKIARRALPFEDPE